MATEKTKFWSRWGAMIVVGGILTTVGAFIFTRVMAFPENYPTKTEVNAVEVRMATRIKTETTHIRAEQATQMKVVEKGLEQIMRAQEELHKDVREIRSKVQ